MIQPERMHDLNRQPERKGRYVLYWMQSAQRAECNHALEFAVREANRQALPLIVSFVLTGQFPEANLRHYTFMLEGLKEVHETLEKRGIPMVLRRGEPEEEIPDLLSDAAMGITDLGYLRIQETWRRRVAGRSPCRMVAVETDVVVPVDAASEREAYSAAVLRPKIQRLLSHYLVPLIKTSLKHKSLDIKLPGVALQQTIPALLRPLHIVRSVSHVAAYEGGTSRAKELLAHFIKSSLSVYHERRNDPGLDIVSHMSPYLHFGQISPLYVALEISRARGVPLKSREAYLEEIIVRRELSMNFVRYNPAYDTYEALPAWAQATLQKHEKDQRPYLYTAEELEEGRTHDPYWNAAQQEMVKTGKMQNYMRMYWGKKIIEWTAAPREAFRTALYLNNKYELDGRDANSFAGVAWCFGKHDRPWAERPVFGNVRYMNDAGLRRKFDMKRYLEKVSAL